MSWHSSRTLPDSSDGHFITQDGKGWRVTEVYSTSTPPRLPGDGCGCERLTRSDGYVVLLCDRHGREPDIVRYMLD